MKKNHLLITSVATLLIAAFVVLSLDQPVDTGTANNGETPPQQNPGSNPGTNSGGTNSGSNTGTTPVNPTPNPTPTPGTNPGTTPGRNPRDTSAYPGNSGSLSHDYTLPQFIHGLAFISSTDLITKETFPVQVEMIVRGYVADGCTAVDTVTQQRTQQRIDLTIKTKRRADAVCTQATQYFERRIALNVAGLPKGTYTVNVNGKTTTFGLKVDNSLSAIIQGKNGIYAGDQKPGQKFTILFALLEANTYIVIREEAPGGAAGKIIGSSKSMAAGKYENSIIIPLTRAVHDKESFFATVYKDDGDGRFDAAKDKPILDNRLQEVESRGSVRLYAGQPQVTLY